MLRTYIAIGAQCWGQGATRGIAVAQMKKNWPSFLPKTGIYEVHSCPEGSEVNGFGGITYPKDAAKPPFVVSRGESVLGRTGHVQAA